MKNNTIFVISFILYLMSFLTTVDSTAQEYIPMNFEQGVWINEKFNGGDFSYTQRYCDGDTLIDNRLSHKLYEIEGWPKLGEPGLDLYGPKLIGFIYEDEDRRVFYKAPVEDTFKIAYDYNLELGDTIDLGDPTYGDYFQFIINEIDSIEICGIFHKRYIHDLFGGSFPYTLTEGIGFSNGILGFLGLMDFEASDQLLCYTEWQNPDCEDCYILLSTNKRSIRISVFPNPANEEIFLSSSNLVVNAIVYNELGFEIIRINNLQSNQIIIPTNNLGSGLYLIKLFFIDQSSSTVKFIKN